jgi:hypothetical protein
MTCDNRIHTAYAICSATLGILTLFDTRVKLKFACFFCERLKHDCTTPVIQVKKVNTNLSG